METVEVPSLGQVVLEGKVLCWAKLVGDPIQKGEPLVQIETDKANIEISSPASGVVRAIFVAEGETVPVGTVIALVGAPDEPFPASSLSSRQPAEVRQRCRENRPLLVSFRELTGFTAALLALFVLSLSDNRFLGNWMVALTLGLLLITSGFFLGVIVHRWRNKRDGQSKASPGT